MKREIKFRAWHKTEHLMCMVDVFTYQGAFLEGVKNGNDQILDGGKFVVAAPKYGRFCYNDEIEIMQFTGLHDKNGKEIYADDVISNGLDKFRVYVVPGGFSIKAPYWAKGMGDINSGDELIMNPLGEPQNISWLKDHCEVIGNIYENPELINKQ